MRGFLTKFPLVQAICLMAVVLAAVPERAEAYSWTVNGIGWGNATVNVWCWPNAPPAAPNFTAGGAAGFNVSRSLGPGLPGCNPVTEVSSANGALWQNETSWKAGGGDTVDDHSLLPLVTPSSALATGSLVVAATTTGPTSADFFVTWSGSDPGVASHLAWYEGPSLLHSELRVGPWSDVGYLVSITSAGPIEDVELRGSGIAVTLPEPATLSLLALGGLVVTRRRRLSS